MIILGFFLNDIELVGSRPIRIDEADLIPLPAKIKDYLKKHNEEPQTRMEAFTERGAQTRKQFIVQTRQFFLKRGRASRHEVLDYLKQHGVPGPERVSISKGLLFWLKERGIEVLG